MSLFSDRFHPCPCKCNLSLLGKFGFKDFGDLASGSLGCYRTDTHFTIVREAWDVRDNSVEGSTKYEVRQCFYCEESYKTAMEQYRMENALYRKAESYELSWVGFHSMRRVESFIPTPILFHMVYTTVSYGIRRCEAYRCLQGEKTEL